MELNMTQHFTFCACFQAWIWSGALDPLNAAEPWKITEWMQNKQGQGLGSEQLCQKIITEWFFLSAHIQGQKVQVILYLQRVHYSTAPVWWSQNQNISPFNVVSLWTTFVKPFLLFLNCNVNHSLCKVVFSCMREVIYTFTVFEAPSKKKSFFLALKGSPGVQKYLLCVKAHT